MACRMTKISLLVILLAWLWNGTTAQSGCTTTLMGLSPCLNYVNGNSSTPSSSCCSQLSGVVRSQPQCLCLLLNGTESSYGFNLNQTSALALPGACKVQTPPASRCNGSKSVPSENGGSNIKAPCGVAVILLFIASYALSVAGF